MKSKYSKLFHQVNIGKLTIKNRTSMAPMGLVAFSDSFGGFNEKAQDYYIERAKGGVGLIITGICSINYYELTDYIIPCPSKNPAMFIKSTAQMNEKIHSYDSKIFLQLTGGLGRVAIPGPISKINISASENTNRFNPSILDRPMTIDEIKMYINDFAMGAAIAKQAGFDGVEIHAVHEGYLLDQFATACFNRRTDEYGGDLKGRLKFATDIVKAIKKTCGENYPVSMRYSVKSFMKDLRQGALPSEEFKEYGKDLAEGIEAAKILVEAGYDALNVDAGTYDSWYWNHPPMYFEKGMYRQFGKSIKEAVDIPVILAGRMDDPDIAIEALDNCCDLVSYGRPLLADPYLVEKIQKEDFEDVRPCLSCHQGCMDRIAKGLPVSCAVNPSCGREMVYGIKKSDIKKNILVVGGGVAGLEASRVCAIRGHEVTLVEALDKLGGNLIPGSVPEFKIDDRRLIKWYERQLDKLNIKVEFNTKFDEKYLENHSFDAIICAIGSEPIIPDFGYKNNICTAVDVLNGKKDAGENIVVIGGGLVGCETALWLSKKGKKVSIVEMLPEILGGMHGMPAMNYFMLCDLLNYNHVDIYTNSKVLEVKESSVIISNEKEIKADTVIIATGFKKNDSLQKQLYLTNIPTYNIGDSRNVSDIMHAIWDAYEVARGI